MNAAPLVSATQLHRNREHSEITLSVAEWVDWRRKEQDVAWIFPVLTSAKNIVSPLSIYTAIKAMALSSANPTPMKISPDRESFIPSWYFTAEATRMSENHIWSYRKATVGKKDHLRSWQITSSSYRNTLNQDHDASTHCINLGNYLDKNTWCRYFSQVMLHSLLVLHLSTCSEV